MNLFLKNNCHKIYVYCIQNDRMDHTNSTKKKKMEKNNLRGDLKNMFLVKDAKLLKLFFLVKVSYFVYNIQFWPVKCFELF